MEQQAGAAELCLDVQSATFFPRCHKIEDVRVRTEALVVLGFPRAPAPLTVAPEAVSRALDCILATVQVAFHLEK